MHLFDPSQNSNIYSSLLRNNANHYWLSVTLKCAPETYPLIVNVLENPDVKTQKNKYLVHGLIAVLNAGRAHNLLKQIVSFSFFFPRNF